MAKYPKFNHPRYILQHFLNLYYLTRSRNPGLKQDPNKHIKEIEKLETQYHKVLIKNNYPEDYNDQLRKEIDFLTGVFEKEEKERKRKEELKSFQKRKS